MCYISPKIQRSTCNRSIINKCYWIITTLNLYRWILNSCDCYKSNNYKLSLPSILHRMKLIFTKNCKHVSNIAKNCKHVSNITKNCKQVSNIHEIFMNRYSFDRISWESTQIKLYIGFGGMKYFYLLASNFVVSTKCSDPWVLEFVVSNTTDISQWENCISLDFNFHGLSEPWNPQKLECHD
jgi:hypothetical protein